MKPIATRLLLVFVSMVVLLSCAATVGGAERARGEPRKASLVTPDGDELDRLEGVITVVWVTRDPTARPWRQRGSSCARVQVSIPSCSSRLIWCKPPVALAASAVGL